MQLDTEKALFFGKIMLGFYAFLAVGVVALIVGILIGVI